MTHNPLILVGGGSRSGKSNFGLAVARRLGSSRLFVATGQPGDEEMRARIRRHRETRGPDFQTVEEPLAIVEVLERTDGRVVVLDCLTFWIANLLMAGMDAETVACRVEELAGVLELRRTPTVIVSSEVGLGLVPESPLGRIFRDVVGLAHQRLAGLADEVYFGVMGVMLRLKPGPVVSAEEYTSHGPP